MNIRDFMQENNLQYLLVNTTNEFLVEYNTLEENSLFKITGFTGSTGIAIVVPETVYLFVDGRYHIQADLEVNHDEITVVKLQSGQTFINAILEKLPEGGKLGIFSKKNSVDKIEEYSKYYNLVLIDNDPFDSDIHCHESENVVLGKNLTGLDLSEKGKLLSSEIDLADDEVVLINDLDDISYLFNMRNYSVPYSAKIKGKALLFKNNIELYPPEKFDELENFLHTTDYKVLIDTKTTSDYIKNLINGEVYKLDKSISKMKSHKNENELKTLQDAFARTDNALSAVRDYIYSNDGISEYDIDQKLREEFKKQGAVGLSFKPIVAKDKNSALAHYSKSSNDEIISDGSLILIDCGAYFEGGLATDITRVFVKGEPSELQKKVYTTVLKAFLLGINSDERIGFDIDAKVRRFLNENAIDGFVFNHGLGHGIGINVHEYPPNLSNGELAKVKIEDGMCFTIEPGLYKEGEFGVRLENSCFLKDNKICSFVHMNYEKKLIDFDMLTDIEKGWLSKFEVK